MRELGMTAAEIAAATGLSDRGVRRLVETGTLPRLAGTRRVIVPTVAVQRWIEQSIEQSTNGKGPQQIAAAEGQAPTTERTREPEHPAR